MREDLKKELRDSAVEYMSALTELNKLGATYLDSPNQQLLRQYMKVQERLDAAHKKHMELWGKLVQQR